MARQMDLVFRIRVSNEIAEQVQKKGINFSKEPLVFTIGVQGKQVEVPGKLIRASMKRSQLV
jgi:extradiol dioxygenase family protein